MKKRQKIKQQKKLRRRVRVRAKVFGTAKRPRLSVFRSAKHLYLQLIDDNKGQTLVSASDQELKDFKGLPRVLPRIDRVETGKAGKKTEIAAETGKLLAKKAKQAGIEEIVFDRSGHKYHGRIRAVAEAAREAGLKF